jgi:hypothetical protein
MHILVGGWRIYSNLILLQLVLIVYYIIDMTCESDGHTDQAVSHVNQNECEFVQVGI